MREAKATKTRFCDPYRRVGDKYRTNLPLKRGDGRSGVYLIKDKADGKIVYVGFSNGNLYDTLYRHFQFWKDISRTCKVRFTYPKEGCLVRIIFTTPSRASVLEKWLISRILPRDNHIKYASYLSQTQRVRAEETMEDTELLTKGEDPGF